MITDHFSGAEYDFIVDHGIQPYTYQQSGPGHIGIGRQRGRNDDFDMSMPVQGGGPQTVAAVGVSSRIPVKSSAKDEALRLEQKLKKEKEAIEYQEKFDHDFHDKLNQKSAIVLERLERKKEMVRALNQQSVEKAKKLDAQNEARRLKQALDKVQAKEEKTAKISEQRAKLLQEKSRASQGHQDQVKERRAKLDVDFQKSIELKEQQYKQKDEQKRKLIASQEMLVIELSDHKKEVHESLMRRNKNKAEMLEKQKKKSIIRSIKKREKLQNERERYEEEENFERIQ